MYSECECICFVVCRVRSSSQGAEACEIDSSCIYVINVQTNCFTSVHIHHWIFKLNYSMIWLGHCFGLIINFSITCNGFIQLLMIRPFSHLVLIFVLISFDSWWCLCKFTHWSFTSIVIAEFRLCIFHDQLCQELSKSMHFSHEKTLKELLFMDILLFFITSVLTQNLHFGRCKMSTAASAFAKM